MMTTPMLILALLCVACGHLEAADEPSRKPNIVFVLFDDIGYGQPTSYLADSPFKTPYIDCLVHEGMRFINQLVPRKFSDQSLSAIEAACKRLRFRLWEVGSWARNRVLAR